LAAVSSIAAAGIAADPTVSTRSTVTAVPASAVAAPTSLVSRTRFAVGKLFTKRAVAGACSEPDQGKQCGKRVAT
jgi:hypothetical protein